MSDRILVLHEGRITAEIATPDATEESVMFAATGQDAEPTAPAADARDDRWLSRSSRPRRTTSLAARMLGLVAARQRELSLAAVMVVARRIRGDPGAAVPVGVEPDPGDRVRRDHRASRRSARRSSS